jgi:anti-sigma regulatory factor (Ser/Thr protein kinase)
MCKVTPAKQLTLDMDQRAPAEARRFVRDVHCNEHNASVRDDVALLVSELVTNAVRHGAPPVTIEVGCDESGGMQVRVSDGDPGSPTPNTADVDDESGRGMALVDMLSDDWGVDPTPDGKAVWFRLRS